MDIIPQISYACGSGIEFALMMIFFAILGNSEQRAAMWQYDREEKEREKKKQQKESSLNSYNTHRYYQEPIQEKIDKKTIEKEEKEERKDFDWDEFVLRCTHDIKIYKDEYCVECHLKKDLFGCICDSTESIIKSRIYIDGFKPDNENDRKVYVNHLINLMNQDKYFAQRPDEKIRHFRELKRWFLGEPIPIVKPSEEEFPKKPTCYKCNSVFLKSGDCECTLGEDEYLIQSIDEIERQGEQHNAYWKSCEIWKSWDDDD